ncbi:hypothetical protein SOJ_27120 [Staphylococcus sp. OJ82]|nr:hypothetical protein SOJ_27120 [Staphylococcus sp. OJ82]
MKKSDATDSAYKQMVNKVAPFMYITLAVSVTFLIIFELFE